MIEIRKLLSRALYEIGVGFYSYEDIRKLIQDGVDFKVTCVKTNKDITCEIKEKALNAPERAHKLKAIKKHLEDGKDVQEIAELLETIPSRILHALKDRRSFPKSDHLVEITKFKNNTYYAKNYGYINYKYIRELHTRNIKFRVTCLVTKEDITDTIRKKLDPSLYNIEKIVSRGVTDIYTISKEFGKGTSIVYKILKKYNKLHLVDTP